MRELRMIFRMQIFKDRDAPYMRKSSLRVEGVIYAKD